jgi:3-hydroxyisobutyrate dehydrogenase-like beta-hydroxyacid dehydrogenase
MQKARWLVDDGMRPAGTPKETAEAAEIVFNMATNNAIINAPQAASRPRARLPFFPFPATFGSWMAPGGRSS